MYNEFPEYNDDIWHKYDNPIENKKSLNKWNTFPPTTCQVLSSLNSNEFLNFIQKRTGVENIFSDSGLNGAGWHIHNRGGMLNAHLDYNLHPKLGLQRKYNLIIYLEKDWKKEWGGGLAFGVIMIKPQDLEN